MGLALGSAVIPRAVAEAQTSAEEQALALYNRAEERFRTDEFETAALLLREAIGLYDAAPMHFNLARALRELGKLDEARAEYALFLEMEPDTTRRGVVEARIAEIDREIATAEAAAAAEREDNEAAEAEVAEAEDSLEGEGAEDGGGPSLAPWLLAASAVVPLGVGVAFGVLFNGEVDAARDADDHQQAADHASTADTYALVANISFVAGALMGVAGLAWGLIDVMSVSDGETDVAVRVGPGSVEIAGTF